MNENIIKYNLESEYPFKSHFLQIGDNNLHFVDVGQGPVILMVHGNPTWSFYFRNLIKYYSEKGYRVIAPDHMGCGLSDKPQSYNYCLENHVENLLTLSKFLNLSKVTLVVHDWGGAIGFGLAAKMPNLVTKAVILNTAAFHLDYLPKRISFCKIPYLGPFMVRFFNAFAWPATFMTTTRPLQKNIKKGYLFPYNSFKNRIAVARFVQDIPMTSDHQTYAYLKQIENTLPQMTFPKIILWGGKDWCFNNHFFAKWLQIFPDAEYRYFRDAGHYVIEDVPEKIIQNIDVFLGQTKQAV